LAAYVLKKLNVLRVPVEVELEGLDLAEYETDFYPEHGRAIETIIEPAGEVVPSDAVLAAELEELLSHNGAGPRAPTTGGVR
jgi:hypothetical protein